MIVEPALKLSMMIMEGLVQSYVNLDRNIDVVLRPCAPWGSDLPKIRLMRVLIEFWQRDKDGNWSGDQQQGIIIKFTS